MIAKIKTKTGTVTVDTNRPADDLFTPENPLYKAVEKYFNWHVKKELENHIINVRTGDVCKPLKIMPKKQAINEGIWKVIEFCSDMHWEDMNTKFFWMIGMEDHWSLEAEEVKMNGSPRDGKEGF